MPQQNWKVKKGIQTDVNLLDFQDEFIWEQGGVSYILQSWHPFRVRTQNPTSWRGFDGKGEAREEKPAAEKE